MLLFLLFLLSSTGNHCGHQLHTVDARVARSAECDQVLFFEPSTVTAEGLMMDFKLAHAAADLAAPAVAPKNLEP